MKSADIEIGQEYAVSTTGTGRYARSCAIRTRVLEKGVEYRGAPTYYGTHGALLRGIKVKLLERDAGRDPKGAVVVVPPQQVFRPWAEEEVARADRDERDRLHQEAEQANERELKRAARRLRKAGVKVRSRDRDPYGEEGVFLDDWNAEFSALKGAEMNALLDQLGVA